MDATNSTVWSQRLRRRRKKILEAVDGELVKPLGGIRKRTHVKQKFVKCTVGGGKKTPVHWEPVNKLKKTCNTDYAGIIRCNRTPALFKKKDGVSLVSLWPAFSLKQVKSSFHRHLHLFLRSRDIGLVGIHTVRL